MPTSGRSPASGSRPSWRSRPRPRCTRRSMVWVPTRNAWPISPGDRPHSHRRIRVTCVSRFRPGSHTANIIASWLALSAARASAASIAPASAVDVASPGRNERWRCSRRMMPIARLRAARMIHAFGSCGNPKRQARTALTSASWTTSSASAMLDGPRTRVSALTRYAYTFRNTSPASPAGDTPAGPSPTNVRSEGPGPAAPRPNRRTRMPGTCAPRRWRLPGRRLRRSCCRSPDPSTRRRGRR